MVAVYNTFGEVEAGKAEARSNVKYYMVLGAACTVLAVAAVLVAGIDTSDETVLLNGGRMQMLAYTHGMPPEKDWADEFDAGFTPEMKFKYDLANEAAFNTFNIASGVDGDTVTDGIPDPYADQSARVEVPDAVYSQPAPYKTNVVEIGEQTLGKPFHEYLPTEEGDVVMGKDYVDNKFDKTLNSVPEPNPARDWDFLDTDTEGGTLPKGY